jgi:hypothetical protein
VGAVSERCKVIDLSHGSTSESWLVIYADGRINYHVENDGWRAIRRGLEARDEWIDLDYVRNYWPQLLPRVEAAILELAEQP